MSSCRMLSVMRQLLFLFTAYAASSLVVFLSHLCFL